MIVGIGIDIIEITKLRRAVERSGDRFLVRVFTEDEVRFCMARRDPYQHLAARFAAKEAAMKALASGWGKGISWKDIEVIPGKEGAPLLECSGEARRHLKKLGGRSIHVSLSHQRSIACASVIIES